MDKHALYSENMYAQIYRTREGIYMASRCL